MTTPSLFETVMEFQFGEVFQRPGHIFIDSSEYLRISPNGQYVALSNEENLYLFDLQQPELSWQKGMALESANGVVPCDSGGYWISKFESVQFINSDGTPELQMKRSWDKSLWGNDHWLLMHHKNQLRFTKTSDCSFCITSFKHMVIHAWEHKDKNEGVLRLLCTSGKGNCLQLFEWTPVDGSKPKLVSRLKSPLKITSRDYYYFRDIHAWPLAEDNSMLIKLVPWAVIVNADGEMRASKDHVAWHPVFQDSAMKDCISRPRLAEITICALDEGMSASGLGRESPYLITTLVLNDTIHIITSEWHKRVSIRNIDQLTDYHLNTSLVKSHELVTLLLANSGRSLIELQKSLPGTIVKMLAYDKPENRYNAVMVERIDQIHEMFEVLFTKRLQYDIKRCGQNFPGFLDDMNTLLTNLSQTPLNVPALFAVIDNHSKRSKEDQLFIESAITTLLPILPEHVRKMIPDRYCTQEQSFCDTLANISDGSAQSLLEHAPVLLFDCDTLIFALNRCGSDQDMLVDFLLCRKKIWRRAQSFSQSDRERLSRTLRKLLNKQIYFSEICLSSIVAYQLLTPKDLNYFGDLAELGDPHAYFIDMLHHGTPTEDVAVWLACHSVRDGLFSSEVIASDMKVVQRKRLIPSIILIMVLLTDVKREDEFLALDIFTYIEGVTEPPTKDIHVKVASLWEHRLGLNDHGQWALAVLLLAAIKRSLSESDIASLVAGHTISNRYAGMTAEARLIHKDNVDLTPTQQMLALLASETGMAETHKKVSESVLETYASLREGKTANPRTSSH